MSTGLIDKILYHIGMNMYPVGSIYMSVNSTNPSTYYGGTWERIQDRFLLACGSSYANGSTGGAATVTLAAENMPKHSHSYTKPPTATGSHTLTVSEMPSHWHKVERKKKGTGTRQDDIGFYNTNAAGGSYWSLLTGADGNQTFDIGTQNVGGGKGHTHGITNSSANTGEKGSGTAHNNMPPYLAVYVWKRTA